MRIAISTDGDSVSMHFGRCPSFTLVDIENGQLLNKTEVANPGHQPGAIPQFLHEKGVNCIIAGGMGMRATSFFEEYGIKTIVGVSGKIDEVIEKLKQNTLVGGESLCRPGEGKGYGLEKTECDFVIKEGLKISKAIQVTLSLTNPNTKKREVLGLINAMKKYNLDSGLILTQDEEGEEIINGKKITILPVWKWLLSE